MLCTPQEDWCQVMVERFEEEFGVDTNYVRLSSGEALARLQAGAESPEFSVWWGGPADGFVAANAEGLLESYVSPNAEAIPDDKKDADGVWTGVYVGALGFCSNTAVLEELGVDVPTSWDDLTDPALAGQVAIAHPASSGTSYTALFTQVLRLGGEDEAIAYAQEVHQNVLQYTSSGAAPAEMAGRGEVAVSIVFSHDCVRNIEAGFTDLEVPSRRRAPASRSAAQRSSPARRSRTRRRRGSTGRSWPRPRRSARTRRTRSSCRPTPMPRSTRPRSTSTRST